MKPKLVIVIALIAAIAIIVWRISGPTIDPYTSKHFVPFVVTQTQQLRQQIGSEIIKNGTTTLEGITTQSADSTSLRINYERITRYGEIIAFNEELNALVLLEPMVVEGRVVWKCLGYFRGTQKNCDETVIQ